MKTLAIIILCLAGTLSFSQAGKHHKQGPAAAAVKAGKKHHQHQEKRFTKLDKNSDGQLSKEEFLAQKPHQKQRRGKRK
jgi:hypothetical protein